MDHCFTMFVTGTLIRPAAHDEENPFATDTDPPKAVFTLGCAVHRVAVDAVPDRYAYSGFAVHEYDQYSYSDNDAD